MLLATVLATRQLRATDLARALGVGVPRARQLLAGDPLAARHVAGLASLVGAEAAQRVWSAQQPRLGSGRHPTIGGAEATVRAAKRLALRLGERNAVRALERLEVRVAGLKDEAGLY